MSKSLQAYLRLLRIHQWIKNGFIFAPLIFSSRFLDFDSVKKASFAFLVFCMASSSVYIFNDLKDIDKDRLHPVKKLKRPLASGDISPLNAKVLLFVLYFVLISFLIMYPILKFSLLVLIYIVINFFYTFYLKYIPILDIFCIATGFVLRVYAGGEAINVPISSWMLITTLALALYLASTKRLQEIRLTGDNARKVLKSYTVKLLEKYALVSAIGSIFFYSLFVVTNKPSLVLSVPIVIFGFFRYWYLLENENEKESPTEILWHDWPLAFTVLFWVVYCILKLYSK